MTWGDGDIYETGNGANRSTYTATEELSGRTTTYFLSVYHAATQGSAHAQLYDSGGGAFVNNKIAGIMVAAGEEVTLLTDAGTYGTQINDTLAVPEPGTAISVLLIGGVLVGRRWFMDY